MQDDGGFRDFTYTARDGLRLHARIYGPEAAGGLAVACLPGLSRNARDFHELALALSGDPARPRRVLAFDYRGRGRSAWDRDWRNYTVSVEAADVLDGLAAAGIAEAAFIGTSRGGLIIHLIAALQPSVLRAAVLNDVGPAVEGAGLARIRGQLQRAPKPRDLAEGVALIRAANGAAFPALSAADWQRWAAATYRETDGAPVADYDPALLKTLEAIDFNAPLPELWPQFDGLASVPLLAIRGEHSDVLSAATLAEMVRRHPAIETVTVAGQGHAPLLETAGLPERIAAFVARAEAARPGA